MLKQGRPSKLSEMISGQRRIMRHIAPYMPQYRGLIVGSGLALIGATVMRLLEPWPLKLVIDQVVKGNHNSKGSGIAFLDALSSMELLAVCSAMVVVTIGVRAIFEYLSTIGFSLAGSRVLTQLRHDLYRHLQRLSLAFHDRTRTGDLTMRIVSDISLMREAAVTAILPLFTNILILVGMAGVMLALNWKLALIALSPIPVLIFATVRLGHKIQAASRVQRSREGGIASSTAESMAGMRIVQALSLEDRMASIFQGFNSGSLKDGVKAKRLSASLERLTDLMTALSTAMVLWFGALLVIRAVLTPGDLIVFLTYLKFTFRPIRDFAKNTSRMAKATTAGERVIDLLEETPDISDAANAVTAPAFKGAVRFENVGFGYGDGRSVLKSVNLAIEPGQVAALVGPSGVGKSTIASLLMRLYEPTSGRVLIDGCDIRHFTRASLRAQISVVLQESLLFSDSVRENIALARPDATDAEIEAAARLANAHDFIAQMPEGYDTVLAERGVSLSMGQRQRLAIARAALRHSPILILDEPTAGLDRKNEQQVIDALRRLSRGRAVLLITHDLELAAEADMIAVLDRGVIAETGPHADLVKAGGIYTKLYRARMADKALQEDLPLAFAS
jgi:ATP-binding cassette, subfamily B, bacterial